jgi:hypothetical protein
MGRRKSKDNYRISIGVKPEKKRKRILRHYPDYTFMKYWRVVRYWAQRQYGVTMIELEILFFLHDEMLFNKTTFDTYDNIFRWDDSRMARLKEKGLIRVWREPTKAQSRLFELSFKAKKMIASIYKKLNGEEPIPTTPQRNPIFRKNAGFADKTFAIAIRQFNNKVKESKQHPDIE